MKRIVLVLALALALPGLARADDAKTLFHQKCAACHGPDGRSQTPMGKVMGAPDLKAAKLPEAKADEIITNGKGKMASYKGKLSPEQIKSLATYISKGLPE